MKKIKLLLFLLTAMLVSTVFNVNAQAATSISISSSSSVIVDNTITTTVTISSSEPLGSWDFVIGYDSSKLKLLDNTNQRIVGYGDGSIKSKSYTFKFKANTVGTAKVYIDSASYYNWNLQSESVTKGSKTITIKEKSTSSVVTYSKNNYLSSLEIEGYELNPVFNKETLEYIVNLPESTYNIKLVGKAEDSKSSITGLGDVTLLDGENKIEIKVKAENGNIRTYTIKAIVEEPNPINVIVDGKEYTVVRKKDGIDIPANYRETTIAIQGETVLGFYGEITKYNLVALKDDEGNAELYIYNSNDESYKIYKELNFNSINIYPYSITEDRIINGYEKSTMIINNMEVDVLNDTKNYPIIYGMNLNTGEVSYYTYDAKESTLQRYNSEVSNKLEKESKKYLYISIALGSICILELMLMIIVLAVKNNKTRKQLEKTLERTMKLNSINDNKNCEKSKKQIKKEEKQRLKEQKKSRKRLKQNNDMEKL